jgi:pilus assembly protein TadC
MDAPRQTDLATRVRVTQIITMALALGPAAFLAIAIFLRAGDATPKPDMPMLTYVAIGVAAMGVVGRFIVPNVVVVSGRQAIARETSDVNKADAPADVASRLYTLFQAKTIVAGALLEGPAFLAVLAYWQEGQLLSLVVAGVLILGMLLGFPVRTAVEHWIEEQLHELRGQR